MYSERTQVLLSREQAARLKRIARKEGRSVGAVIRDAVDAYAGGTVARRQEALDRLFALEAPVDDWEIMKAQIIEGRFGGLPGWEPGS